VDSDSVSAASTASSSTTTAPADSNPLADYTYAYVTDTVYDDGKKDLQVAQSGSTSQTTTYSYDLELPFVDHPRESALLVRRDGPGLMRQRRESALLHSELHRRLHAQLDRPARARPRTRPRARLRRRESERSRDGAG
jgi:hypothetical protein